MTEELLDPSAGPESPSLFAAGEGGPPAFEVKFLLTEDAAREVQERVKGHLGLDPHADPALGDAYLTTSLYTDTPNLDVLRRTGGLGRDKYRVRRYGPRGPVFVERKTKKGDRVRKHRTPVPAGDWFHREVNERGLGPVCRVAYERVAYTGFAEGGAVRVTFDRGVRGVLASDWDVVLVAPAPSLLAGRVICEFKFRHALPALFKTVIHDLALSPSTVSKYRLFMRSAGVPGAEGSIDA